MNVEKGVLKKHPIHLGHSLPMHVANDRQADGAAACCRLLRHRAGQVSACRCCQPSHFEAGQGSSKVRAASEKPASAVWRFQVGSTAAAAGQRRDGLT